MFDTVDNLVIRCAENNIAVFSHQLHNQIFTAEIAEFIEMFYFKTYDSFQSRLLTDTIFPFPICFLKSMQKFGAVIGLCLFV